MNAKQLLKDGKLSESIDALIQEVRAHPADTDRRGLLAELLCFRGDLERADLQLDTLVSQNPAAGVGASLFRQVLRAEQARQDFFRQGRVPEFLQPPSEELKRYLRAAVLVREGQESEAAEVVAEAESQRAAPKGRCNGEPFEDFRDLDDVTAGVFEILTSTGKYYWIPVQQFELIEFYPPEQQRDLLWRRAHAVVRGGPDGEVFVPAIYSCADQADEEMRLGRKTDWQGGDGTPVRGCGQKSFLVGESMLGLMELQELEFDAGEHV